MMTIMTSPSYHCYHYHYNFLLYFNHIIVIALLVRFSDKTEFKTISHSSSSNNIINNNNNSKSAIMASGLKSANSSNFDCN